MHPSPHVTQTATVSVLTAELDQARREVAQLIDQARRERAQLTVALQTRGNGDAMADAMADASAQPAAGSGGAGGSQRWSVQGTGAVTCTP